MLYTCVCKIESHKNKRGNFLLKHTKKINHIKVDNLFYYLKACTFIGQSIGSTIQLLQFHFIVKYLYTL